MWGVSVCVDVCSPSFSPLDRSIDSSKDRPTPHIDRRTRNHHQDEVAPLFRTLLASTGIDFVQGEVTALDPAARTLSLTAAALEGAEAGTPQEQTKTLPYDRLVLALGSEPVVPALPSMQGKGDSKSNSMSFYRLEDAERLAQKLEEMEARSQRGGKALFRVVIVGGGYSGVELAANLAARLGRDRCVLIWVGLFGAWRSVWICMSAWAWASGWWRRRRRRVDDNCR